LYISESPAGNGPASLSADGNPAAYQPIGRVAAALPTGFNVGG